MSTFLSDAVWSGESESGLFFLNDTSESAVVGQNRSNIITIYRALFCI